ncbi:MAG: hypothetical protein F4W68_06565 [Cenarchaeum sp. SB0661_bin_35]|nr:hypothetical protein [Cenarchaeum sp. SB0661_bin_35]MYI51494.1 hypothetical protein [Cenarchaeum sp. SB0673_bin_9]
MAVGIVVFMPPCWVEHQALLYDIEQYLLDMGPETCEVLLERIDSYNVQCNGTLGILDCG